MANRSPIMFVKDLQRSACWSEDLNFSLSTVLDKINGKFIIIIIIIIIIIMIIIIVEDAVWASEGILA